MSDQTQQGGHADLLAIRRVEEVQGHVCAQVMLDTGWVLLAVQPHTNERATYIVGRTDAAS